MLYWECKRRLALLREFRTLTYDYFQHVQKVGRGHRSQQLLDDEAQKARHRMNGIIPEVAVSLDFLRIPHTVFYQPPPLIGGYAQPVDVISNIFSLWEFPISTDKVFDCLDRAIGAYERLTKKLFRNIFNPFYWLERLFVWILRFPFKLLGAAGFDSRKIEQSLAGKLIKLAGGLIVGFATVIVAAIEVADRWSLVQQFMGRCAAFWHAL